MSLHWFYERARQGETGLIELHHSYFKMHERSFSVASFRRHPSSFGMFSRWLILISAKILARVQNYTNISSLVKHWHSWTLTSNPAFLGPKTMTAVFSTLTWRKCWLMHSVICWIHSLSGCKGLCSCGASQCQQAKLASWHWCVVTQLDL